jgi:hypothetical protein
MRFFMPCPKLEAKFREKIEWSKRYEPALAGIDTA